MRICECIQPVKVLKWNIIILPAVEGARGKDGVGREELLV
jgi:hypothetical protein